MSLMTKHGVRGTVPTAGGRLPVVGHVVGLHRDALGFLQSLRQYGPMVRIFIGPRPVYVVNSPELIREVLAVQARGFNKGAVFDTLRLPLGNGLVTSTGDFHRRQRRLMQPAFHADRIARYTDIMAEQCAAWTAAWEPGQRLDLVKEINRLSLEILMRTLFASEPGPELRAAVKDWLSVKYKSMRLALSPWQAWCDRIPVLPGWEPPDPGPLNRLRAVQQEIVVKYRAAGTDRGDLLSMLIQAEGSHGAMSDSEILDELITLYLAATGTVSAVLAWAVHEVAAHREVEARLHTEVDAVLGTRPPRFEDLPALQYTRQIVTETLRLYPVAWLSMRRTIQTLHLGGVLLPAGTDVFLSPYALQRDPQVYDDPDRFDPGRWPADRPGVPRQAFLPFGAGNRVCIGERFAWAELTCALATLAGRWRLVPTGDEVVRTEVGTVVRPERLPMTVLSRSQNAEEGGHD